MLNNRWLRGTVIAMTLAAALTAGSVASDSATGREATSWNHTKLTGHRAGVTSATRAAARLSRVDPATIVEVVAAGSGGSRLALVAGARTDGARCLAARTRALSGSFNCLGVAQEDLALLYFETVGGPAPGVINRARVVGVARADVSAIRVETAAGPRNLSLGPARTFAYAADRAAAVPTALVALDATERVIQTFQLEPKAAGS